MGFAQTNSMYLRNHYMNTWKISKGHIDLLKTVRTQILIISAIFIVAVIAGLAFGASFSLAVFFGFALCFLPVVICFAGDLNNYRMMSGSTGWPKQASLSLNGGCLNLTLFRPHAREQFIVDLSTVKYIVYFTKTQNLHVFGFGQDISQSTPQSKPTVVEFGPNSLNNIRRWVEIPLVFEDNNGIISHISRMSGVRVEVSDSADEDIPRYMFGG